ncbi:DUF6491 family protein [Brevundimonas sp.]|uniref:DUF6491 family protein n=1 Tax=Brevundimonas sp. TaxID=1871086 RepID=UPI0028975F64|nr:DUF6491 family protein [Brevundimonas sp.]
MSRTTPRLTIGLLALAGCAPVPAPQPLAAAPSHRQCLFPDDVQDFRVVSKTKTVLVRDTGNAVFELRPADGCRDLSSAMRLAVADQATRLCAGDWTMISTSSAPGSCRARIIKRLSPTEVAALPDQDRP